MIGALLGVFVVGALMIYDSLKDIANAIRELARRSEGGEK